jgi:peptide/nickel transport system substrate-binding protein
VESLLRTLVGVVEAKTVTVQIEKESALITPPSRSRDLTRRRLLGSALAGSAALVLPWPVFAQDATPAATGETIRSQTREEFLAQYVEERGYSEAATPGGTLIESNIADIQTVQPFLVEESASSTIAALIFEPLVGGSFETGQPAPTALADSWEIAPDGRTYTFYLNQNALWHDGVPVTADDVVFSFDALANPETGSTYTGTFTNSIESWRAIDDHTVEVLAREQIVSVLYDLLAAYIVPRHIWEGVALADWRNDPGATGADPSRVVGSGPFKFQEWQQGQSVTLVRNDQYYGKVPYIDTFIMSIWPDQTAAVNALLGGEIDALELEPADVSTVEGAPGLVTEAFDTRDFTYYEFNLDPEVTTLWQDERVRQAFMYALDRESMVNDIRLGYGTVAQGTQPVISYAYAPEEITTVYTYDPEKAKSLLADAGWTDSDGDGVVDKDGVPLAFEFLYPGGSPTWDQVAAYLQDAWAAIGVSMTPRSLEFPALIEATTTNPTFDVAGYSFLWDATFIQDAMFGCDQYQVGFNDMRYCNEEVDALNDEAKRTFDEERRRDLLIQVSNILNDEQPIGVMFFSRRIFGFSDRLRNYIPTTWGVDYPYVWIQQ